MPQTNTTPYHHLQAIVMHRSFAAVLAFFVAIYPLSVILQALFGSVWDVPILASVYGIYFTVAFTLPAALTIPITEAMLGTNVYHAGRLTMVLALAVTYLVLSAGIAGLYRTIRSAVLSS